MANIIWMRKTLFTGHCIAIFFFAEKTGMSIIFMVLFIKLNFFVQPIS